MTDKTYDELKAEALAKVLNAAQATGDFVLEQAPQVIKQLLVYNAVEKGVVIAALIAVICGCLYGVKKCIGWLKDTDGASLVGVVILSIAALGCSWGVVSNALDLIKILVAPKVWLLEYAASLVR